MPSHRFRAATLMTLLWGAGGALIACLISMGFWFSGFFDLEPSKHLFSLGYIMGIYASLGVAIGTAGGALFATALIRNAGNRGIDDLSIGTVARWGMFAGALAGVIGMTVADALLAGGRLHVGTESLVSMLIGGVAGLVTGGGVMALARRAPAALSSGERPLLEP